MSTTDTTPESETPSQDAKTTIVYNDKITRQFIAASVIFGIVGLLLGVVIALQLAFWPANVTQYFSFGRLRPLHTNAVIFAFVGNMIFAGIYYSSQRLLKVRLPSDKLGAIHFWGWQLIILSAVLTLPLGITQGKEYAELEWPIDIAIAGIWLVFAFNFFWMLKKRNEKQLYVALWFYIASIITVTVLHVVNSLVIPVGLFKSYPIFAGVQDALVQWWYGHNAVAFFLTTPVLGIMYYFVPKAANRPVFSYRLSIIHFWALVFLYIWAGPHHLLNTALPDWAQTLGVIFSLMLWAPSWGGMLNGLLTLRGAWDQLRKDPVLKFFAAGLTFYGMATFEGPLLSIKAVSSLAHYTDWIIGHVHAGALGWNGFMAAGMFYWLVPRLYGTKLYSREAANLHFYIGTFGILMYVVAMWVAGITQGMMWRATLPDGGLMYPNFIETLIELRLMYWMRMIGGLIYLVGFVIMAWNLVMTVKSGKAVDGKVQVYLLPEAKQQKSWKELAFAQPMQAVTLLLFLAVGAGLSTGLASSALLIVLVCAGILTMVYQAIQSGKDRVHWHHIIEGRAMFFSVLVVLAVLLGGIAEIIPSIISSPAALQSKNTPYTPLELEGRDVYLAEGCYNCHSQMIRPFTWETARYGAVSTPDESVFDHPFQWGSKRTGPDLARVGTKYAAAWHYDHMIDPRQASFGSNMPPYPHLVYNRIDCSQTASKMRAMRSVGVPYSAMDIEQTQHNCETQAAEIVKELKETANVMIAADSELVALIAYLSRLGNPPPSNEEDEVTAETADNLNQENL